MQIAESKHTEHTKSLPRPLPHLSPPSIICECLFCHAKLIMIADRRSMDPSTLEMLLILKFKKDLCANYRKYYEK